MKPVAHSQPSHHILLDHHQDELRSGGLREETTRRANIHSEADPSVAAALLGWKPGGSEPPVPGIVFPYGDGHCRYRPDTPHIDADGKPAKYLSPVGQPPRPYGLATLGELKNDEMLLLVEGEKKTLVGQQVGIATLGGSGVWGFHDTEHRRDTGEWRLHPPLVPLVVGRPVTVVFDTDIDTNDYVTAAAGRLLWMLREAGAEPSITYIDHPEERFGIDDLYVALGEDDDAFLAALEASHRPAAPDALTDWNKERWERWDEGQRSRELERAARLVRTYDGQFGRWLMRTAKALSVSAWKIRKLSRLGDDCWMSAWGYEVIPTGSLAGVWTLSDGELHTRVCHGPIGVVEVCESEDGEAHLTLRWIYGGREVRETVSRAVAADRGLISLAARGAPVTAENHRAVIRFLGAQEAECTDELPRVRLYTRPGWTADGAYVLGDRIIGGEGRVLPGDDPSYRAALTPRGSRDRFVALCRDAIMRFRFAELAWSTAFAGPLLGPLQVRGFLVSIWGPSGGGKTAVSKIAAAAYGDPQVLMLTGDSTKTAREGHLARCRDGLAIFDDTQQADRWDDLTAMEYQLAGGCGRARGTKQGGIQRTSRWRAMGVTTGERPLHNPSTAMGAQNRSVELYGRPLDDTEAARGLHQGLEENHGWAIPEVVEAISTRGAERLQREYDDHLRVLDQDSGEAARKVAVLTVANALAREVVLGEDPAVAKAAALAMGAWVLSKQRTELDAGVDPALVAYEETCAFISANEDAFMGRAPRALGKKIDPAQVGGREVFAVFAEPMRELARRAGFNVQEVTKVWMDRGLLVGQEEKGRAARTQKRIPGLPGRTRGYWVVVDGADWSQVPDPAPTLGPLKTEPSAGLSSNWPQGPKSAAEKNTYTGGEAEGPGLARDETYTYTSGTLGTGGRGKKEREERQRTIGGPKLGPNVAPWGQTFAPPHEVVEDRKAAVEACHRLEFAPVLGLDIETFGPDALDPFTNTIRLVQVASAEHTYVFDLEHLGGMPEGLRKLLSDPARPVVSYNASFEVKNLLHDFDLELCRPVDLYAGSVLAAGYRDAKVSGAHTLAAAADRYLRVHLPKEAATSDWSGPLTPAQLDYAAMDAAVLLPLYTAIQTAVGDTGVEQAWDIENRALVAVAALELRGFALDVERVSALGTRLVGEAQEHREQVKRLLRIDNPASAAQVSEGVRRELGIELPSTRKADLVRALVGHPVLQHLLGFRKTARLATTSASAWLQAAQRDGRVHARFNPLGAPTGRFSSSSPNLQAVPRDAEVRCCFVAAPGHVLVIADYSCIELRVLAQVLREQHLLRCFREGIDPHVETAARFLGIPPAEVTKEQRNLGKPFNFGLCYGMGADTLLEYAVSVYDIALTEQEAVRGRKDYFGLHRDVRAWHRRARVEGPRLLEVRTASGRLRRFDPEGYRLPEYLSTPIQGTAADGFKVALALLHDALRGTGAGVVNLVHDEVVVETPEACAEECKQLVVRCMVEGMRRFLPDVPVEVEATIADRWVKP